MPRAHLLFMLNKMRTGALQGLVEEKVLVVDMKESCSQRQLEGVGRESNSPNMTSCLNWPNRGERKTGRGREEEKREGLDETERRRREETTKRGN